MSEAGSASILAVGEDLAAPYRSPLWTHVASGRAALGALRLMHWDLLLSSLRLPDMPTWALIDRVRRVRPWQKWGLIAPDLTDDDERLARVLGATLVLEEMPPLDELLATIRRINGNRSRPARPPTPAKGHASFPAARVGAGIRSAPGMRART